MGSGVGFVGCREGFGLDFYLGRFFSGEFGVVGGSGEVVVRGSGRGGMSVEGVLR